MLCEGASGDGPSYKAGLFGPAVRGERLSAVLSKPHTVTALLALARFPGISAARLSREMGASQPVTGQVMAEHLQGAGLARVETVTSPFPGQVQWAVTLTALGRRVAAALDPIVDLLPDEEDEAGSRRAAAEEAAARQTAAEESVGRGRTGRRQAAEEEGEAEAALSSGAAAAEAAAPSPARRKRASE